MNELQTVKAKREFYEQGGINRLARQIHDISATIWEQSVDCELRYHDGEWTFILCDTPCDTDHRGFWGASCFGRHYGKQESRDVAHYLFEEVMDAIADSTKQTPPATPHLESTTMGNFLDRLSGRHTVDIPGNGITLPGINAIKRAMHIHADIRLPDGWLWVWRVGGKGEYVGTLPKRIGKYAYKQGKKLSPELLSEIGNLGAQHCEESQTYDFEFVDEIDWSAGDFGDHSSCFWTCHTSARQMLLDNGAGAIRFFRPKTDEGFARAWIIPQSDNCFIVFNGYGITTLPIARILATYLNHAYYQKIRLSNFGEWDRELYINNGTGYLVGPQKIVMATDKINLKWEKQKTLQCHSCCAPISRSERHYNPAGNNFCARCYAEQVFTCGVCTEDHWRILDGPRFDPDGDPICDSCYEGNMGCCQKCKREIWESDAKQFDKHGRILCCQECYDTLMTDGGR